MSQTSSHLIQSALALAALTPEPLPLLLLSLSVLQAEFDGCKPHTVSIGACFGLNADGGWTSYDSLRGGSLDLTFNFKYYRWILIC